MIRWLKGWWLTLIQAWRIRTARIDPNAPCPACGARDGEIKWEGNVKWLDGKKGAVIHTCHVDKARWAERPIVTAEEWDIRMNEVEQGSPAPFLNKPVTRSFGRTA